ncbi:hypothetical protein PVAG01_02531 [Phlyctema vagabunda]|uniref:tRNA dimethylallyltransferase n=1 Tax=Phlyctema vagabunda TaxID=108571 RepID=A0ABR4PQU2_9HELO
MLRRAYSSLQSSSMAQKCKDPLLVVLGATGTGKSQLAVDLASRFNGEIINGDAMQLYHGLPVITNKITIEEQNGIPHHLLGCIPLDEEPWHAGLFKKNAGKIIQEIRSRGRLPILVGGTHYYTQSLLFKDTLIFDASADEDDLESNLPVDEVFQKYPILAGSTENLVNELKQVDPEMAQKWHPNDRRKIQRSLEIFLTTGRKASELYKEQREKRDSRRAMLQLETEQEDVEITKLDSTLLFWVHSEPEILKMRLDNRVDKMIDAGLLKEVKVLDDFLQQQIIENIRVDLTRSIWVSIGWKEFEAYSAAVRSGTATPEQMQSLLVASVEKVKAATRQYAKRQVRWIRYKLMSALSEEGAADNLYLVDSSNVSQWNEDVSSLAISVAEKFLKGAERPKPSELSEVANNILQPKRAEKDEIVRQTCEICDLVTVTESQWQLHLKSRRHRALLKRLRKNKRRSSNDEKQNLSEAENIPRPEDEIP